MQVFKLFLPAHLLDIQKFSYLHNYSGLLLLQDIEIPEMGFPKLEYIQLRAGRVPVGHEFLPLTVCTSAWVNHFRNFNIL